MEQLTDNMINEILKYDEFCIEIFSNLMEYQTIGTLEEFRRFKELDTQGRLFELPCNSKDKVYTDKGSGYVMSMNFNECKVKAYINNCCYEYFNFSDFGKTIFLTRESAEAKLKERESNG